MLDGDLAWALGTALHYEWDDSDRALLRPLVDVTIMRVDTDALEAVARPIATVLWGELQPLLVESLVDQAKRDSFVSESLADALADVELGARRSRLAVTVLAQAAIDLAGDEFFLEDCLDCIEDGLDQAPPDRHPELVARAAAALALHRAPDYGIERPDDGEREKVRVQVRELAALGRESLPRLTTAIEALAAEPLPSLQEDAVLQAVMQRRLAAIASHN
jgi:hypothetical protein